LDKEKIMKKVQLFNFESQELYGPEQINNKIMQKFGQEVNEIIEVVSPNIEAQKEGSRKPSLGGTIKVEKLDKRVPSMEEDKKEPLSGINEGVITGFQFKDKFMKLNNIDMERFNYFGNIYDNEAQEDSDEDEG